MDNRFYGTGINQLLLRGKSIKRILVIVIAALTAVSMLGCSGGGEKPPGGTEKSAAPAEASKPVAAEESKAPGAGAAIEPEQLISKEEAAALAGGVKDGKKTEQPAVGQKIMFYETQDGIGFLQISLNQLAFMSVKGNTPESIYTATKDAIADPAEKDTAQGIGDEYFFGTPGLHILYKGYYITVAAGNPDDAQVREILKQAAAKTIANLDALLG